MEMTKHQLLAFVAGASMDDLRNIRDEAFIRLVEIGAVGVGFKPIPKHLVIGDLPQTHDVLEWIKSVRQPVGTELSNRGLRNQLVYEVEKLGEFAESLQEHILSLPR